MSSYSCDNCGGVFKTAKTLSNHRKYNEHCAPFRHAYFTCMRCGKGYENMKDFKLHARHCRGTKTAYRLPDETPWQTRCVMLEGMIEATLGIKVPSIKISDSAITLGNLERMKQVVKRRLCGEDTAATPIPIHTAELVETQESSVAETGTISTEDIPVTPTEPVTETPKKVEELTVENPRVVPWEMFSETLEPETLLEMYPITGEKRPATSSEYIAYTQETISYAVTTLNKNPTDSKIKEILVGIRQRLVESIGNYASPVVFDVYRVYSTILKELLKLKYHEETAKELLKDYMLPYPLIRFTDLLCDYREIVPTDFDREFVRQMLQHYFRGKFGPEFAEIGGGMVFQVYHYSEAMDTFVFSPQKWWEKRCLYAPGRGERPATNPVIFIVRRGEKWEYDYYLNGYGEEMYGCLVESMRTRFRDIYQLIHATNEYIDDWESSVGVYREDLYNILKSYLGFYSQYTVKSFTEELRLRVAEEAVDTNHKVVDVKEYNLPRPPDKKEAKKLWDKLPSPPIYHRVFEGFQALFDAPVTRKFWDSATGIPGEGGWYYDDTAYERYLQPRFHRLYRTLCSDYFYRVTENLGEVHTSITNDGDICNGFPDIPQLQSPE